MVQLVALFGFWATCEAADFFAAPTRRRGLRLLLSSGLCVISYFPGTVMLGFNLAALLIFSLTGKDRSHLAQLLPPAAALRRPGVLAAIGLGLAALIYLGWFFLHRYYLTITNWGDHYPVHIVTQGRVFWEYAKRIFIPVGLSSDHYQPWSTFRDTGAVFKLAGFALLVAGSMVMTFRGGPSCRRSFGLLLLFALIPFAMRMLYANIEIMVEYRAYHALPWVGLMAGIGMASLADRLAAVNLRWLPAMGLIAVFILLSAGRGAVWRSETRLIENVLQQYPLNNRARNQLQRLDLHAGNYAAVLNRHEEILAIRDRIETMNRMAGGRVSIDPTRANSSVIGSYHFAVLARAELEGCLKALAFADNSIASLRTQLPGEFKPTPGQTRLAASPLIDARDAVERALAAGYP
jgi:hypothetical protein